MQKIREIVNRSAPKAEVFLYGSRAKGTYTNQSDWDILILLNSRQLKFNTEKKFIDDLYEIELETGEVISPLIYTKTEWNKRHLVTPLFENISKDGIRIQ
ncbi:MAG: nucleotidyltransferase domain-containing protein [Bacteroidia bacterium]|nr:nucleotidyltransferase domain-containing protein [Bacteroidia bacterium]